MKAFAFPGPWFIYALGSAIFAAMTAVLGKLGVAEINSNLATFIRTLVILAFAAALISARGEWEPVSRLSGFGALMLILSGVATGCSWLCYYRALQLGPASRVAPVDKLSVALVIMISVVALGETLTWKMAVGGCFIVFGVVLLAL